MYILEITNDIGEGHQQPPLTEEQEHILLIQVVGWVYAVPTNFSDM